MRLLIVLLMIFPLSGCWFIFIPGSAIDALGDSISGHSGNTCVSSTAYIGQQITMPDGSVGVVTKLEGESRRCANPSLPIRAVVEFQPR